MSATNEEINYCLSETHKHVKAVQKNINLFVKDLISRGENHDNSKFEEPELSIFAEKTVKLGQTVYGTDEYKKLLEEVKPAITHHYSKNRHHPEHWPGGVEDMTLVDVLEMLADWKAATMRNKDGNIRKSIEINSQKYNIPPQLRKILENTVREYFKD
jgi:hypothetical protein